MTGLLKFVAVPIGSAACCTALLAMFARPLASMIRHLLYRANDSHQAVHTIL